MNPILDPVGARPSTVYWRRRAMAFAVLAVVILLLARACSSEGPGDLSRTVVQQAEVPLRSTYTPTATPTPTVTATTAAASAASASPTAVATGTATAKPGKGAKGAATPKPTDGKAAGPVKCAKSVLSVSLRADQRSYGAKEKPELYLGVKNMGPTACLADLGSRALSFTVVSGKDRIWSSDDCQGKGVSDIRLLKPGQMLWARSIWAKVRSEPGCPKGLPEAKPGTYLLEGSAGGVKARERAVFQIS